MENVENTPDPIISSPQRPQNEDGSENRNKNLEILKAYIQRQRALLDRIKRDVDRLRASKPVVIQDPKAALTRILQNDNNNNSGNKRETRLSNGAGVGRLSELARDVLGVGEATITKEINWEAFRGQDVGPLHSLQSWLRPQSTPSVLHQHMPPPGTPSTPSLVTPKSSLSSFIFPGGDYVWNTNKKESASQTHVRQMRVKTVDRALTIAAEFLASLPPDSDDESVKQARAKEAREAKEARAKEAKEARNVKVYSGQPTTKSRSSGNIKKSAHRRKSEASAAAAALRPRGQGGRFKKKEQVANETLAPQIPPAGDIANTASVTTSLSGLPLPEAPVSTQYSLTTTSPSAEDLRIDEGGRPQRSRKPSIRFGSVAPSVSSTRSGSSVSGRGNGKTIIGVRMPSSSPSIPNGHTRGRLTIRIPARPPAKSSTQDASEYRDRQTSASTSMSGSTSVAISESAGSDRTVSADHGEIFLGGKSYGGWGAGGDSGSVENNSAPSNSSTIHSASNAHFPNVKQEDDDDDDVMDIDNMNGWDDMEQNGRFKQESRLYRDAVEMDDKSSLRYDAGDPDGGDDDAESDSDDSFVCELLPPLPASSASSSTASATRAASNDNRNGKSNGKADVGRGSTRRGDPSSKTFNVTWSDEEQRLLDMLLVQFPDGTKNRWANISRAMGGTRTPRQVASRVQKYFAKMKKWGIDVG